MTETPSDNTYYTYSSFLPFTEQTFYTRRDMMPTTCVFHSRTANKPMNKTVALAEDSETSLG